MTEVKSHESTENLTMNSDGWFGRCPICGEEHFIQELGVCTKG